MNFDGLPRQARDKYISGKLSKRALCCSAPGGADRDPAPGLATQGWLEPGKKTVFLVHSLYKHDQFAKTGSEQTCRKPIQKPRCFYAGGRPACLSKSDLTHRGCAHGPRWPCGGTCSGQHNYTIYAFKIFESRNFNIQIF